MPKNKILLIDDEENICKLTKMNLERTGEFEVTIAFSGQEGLEKARKQNFDLVVTDFRMPGMNGEEVLGALKTMKSHLPVVLFSIYYDDVSVITESIKKEADGLISKPIDHEQLYMTIKKVLATADGQSPGLRG